MPVVQKSHCCSCKWILGCSGHQASTWADLSLPCTAGEGRGRITKVHDLKEGETTHQISKRLELGKFSEFITNQNQSKIRRNKIPPKNTFSILLPSSQLYLVPLSSPGRWEWGFPLWSVHQTDVVPAAASAWGPSHRRLLLLLQCDSISWARVLQ